MTESERKQKLAAEKIEQIMMTAPTYNTDEIVEAVRSRIEDELRYDFDSELEAFVLKKIKEYNAGVRSLNDLTTVPHKHSLWILPETMDSLNKKRNYWNVYRSNVTKYLHLNDEAISELKDVSLDIVNRLAPPSCSFDSKHKDEYRRKGLVYGNVQSGKTASMGAVISQYVTTGCNFVIVLSGIHNNLWEQTQNRLRRDLDIDSQGGGNLSWRLITATKDGIPANSATLFSDVSGGQNRVIGVFKKNSSVLNKLLVNYLKVNQPGMDRSYLENVSVLIIDDECDQAGIDVSKAEADERSRINACIVELFKFFPRYSYIGYTATPFANVLNEDPGELSMYPSDFITMLPTKKDYYGSTKIFGLGEEFQTYKEHDDPTLKAVQIFSPVKKSGIDAASIRKSLVYFAAATAVRKLRAVQINDDYLLHQHSTMMIHTSGKISDHRDALAKVKEILTSIRGSIRSKELIEEIKAVWNDVYEKSRADNEKAIKCLFSTPLENLYVPKFDELLEETYKVFSKIELRIDNSEADPEKERLSYDDSSIKTNYFVAIGGNTLSRGLTLEGLIVAVFARSARTYDTLLQMGRWFGYRRNYEDLVRLWMTPDANSKMRFLAGIELDLQDTIERYKEETPLTLAMAIRTTPHMQIVRKLAMKAAKAASINYVGRHPQTIYFKNDKAWLESNKSAVNDLIHVNSNCFKGHINDGFLFEGVDSKSISDFIKKYNFDENTNGLDSSLLNKFKAKAEAEKYIDSWNIVIKTKKGPTTHEVSDLIPGESIYLLERGKIGDDSERLYLKAISSPGDIVCDIPDGPRTIYEGKKVEEQNNAKKFEFRNKYFEKQGRKVPGLLVIYPIYQHSEGRSEDRKNLNAKADVYGLSLIFPSLSKITGRFFKSVSIQLPDVISIEGEDYTND